MEQKRNWLFEFSKKIVWIVTIIFVIVYAVSCVLLFFYPDSTAIQFVIESISDVFKVTVVSYAVKAGFENVTKIRRNNNGISGEQLGVPSDCPSDSTRAG